MRNFFYLALASSILGGLMAAHAGPTALTATEVATGLASPLFVTHAPNDYSRIFVLEKPGRIRIIKDGALLPTPFLDITDLVGAGGSEQGLLGLAFHPDYQKNGYFYVNYTNSGGHTIIRRYTVTADPDIADPDSGVRITRVDQPFSNHNGGWIAFGPDEYLYVALGDGGSGCDPGQRAQDLTQLLGKMLRIDVDGDDFPDSPNENYAIPKNNPFVGTGNREEIWAYGLRNPWRNSFDRLTGDLYIADVGQGVVEEINFQSVVSPGGENYGWDCREGTQCSTVSDCTTSGCDCEAGGYVDPIQEYTHGGSPFRCSISGGYVYRGCAIPDLDGVYFYADYCSGQIWSFRYDGTTVTEFIERTAELDPPGAAVLNQITSFGEDAFGELYVCDQGGQVYKIVPAGGLAGPDCNKNGREDACDILSGASADANSDGVPDECQGGCVGDVDADDDTDLSDISLLLSAYGSCSEDPNYNPLADFDASGCVDLGDLSLQLSDFGCL